MQIDDNILITYGGVFRKFEKGETIFWEGDAAHFFYQLADGEVKLFSTNKDGKELIQGIFTKGQSFGEPPLLLGKTYPSTAQATAASVVIRITKDGLEHILEDHPEITTRLLYTFAGRIYNKATAAQILLAHTPREKLIQFLDKYKHTCRLEGKQIIPYTRQQIADFTGLRVETVIRTLTLMKQDGQVDIIDHKLFY